MSKYAKIENGIITNTIICDDSNISLFSGEYIKETENTGTPHIGGTYNISLNKFINIKPYQSWILNQNGEWESPDGFTNKEGFSWNEESQEWVALVSTIEE